jgi:FtsP/CotA-like multicopper oxidase with cupredoxin domain
VHPPKGVGPYEEKDFQSSDTTDDSTTIDQTPFEAYVRKDGSLDWEGDGRKHVCIHLNHEGSHKQLWVLRNTTGVLHNFHSHQMKFRLARRQDLKDHNINQPAAAYTCASTPCAQQDYKYKLYEDSPEPKPVWHDTIPVPNGRVFVIMSFDAAQQVGRFVFHCRILKHEDKGLMAPIEVWRASTTGTGADR